MTRATFATLSFPRRIISDQKTSLKRFFRWKVKGQSRTSSLDVLPPSGRGPSAELNLEEEVIVPSIYASNIEAKLRLIENFGGKKLKNKTPVGKKVEYGHYAIFEDPDGNKMCLNSRK